MELIDCFSGIYNNKKVYITGVTGFKGSWLALWLKNLGAKIIGYSLDPPTNPNHFDLLKLDIELTKGDIKNFELLSANLKKHRPDIIFHLAAQPIVRYSYANPKETFETNVLGTLNLFEACRNAGFVKAIINITSDKCYENKEWIWPYRETDPIGGYDPYSVSKGCSELLTTCYRNSYFNIDKYGTEHETLIASCRAGNVIGGGDWAEDRLIPDMIKSAIAGKEVIIRNPYAIRPWQHVLEPLSGYLAVGQKLLQREKEYAEAWNFGPDESGNYEVIHLAEIMKKKWNMIGFCCNENNHHVHEAQLLKLDSTKARMKLKWKPIWEINKSILTTAAWYKKYYDEGIVLSSDQLYNYINDAKANSLSWTL